MVDKLKLIVGKKDVEIGKAEKQIASLQKTVDLKEKELEEFLLKPVAPPETNQVELDKIAVLTNQIQ